MLALLLSAAACSASDDSEPKVIGLSAADVTNFTDFELDRCLGQRIEIDDSLDATNVFPPFVEPNDIVVSGASPRVSALTDRSRALEIQIPNARPRVTLAPRRPPPTKQHACPAPEEAECKPA
jgi:hypothetical protein